MLNLSQIMLMSVVGRDDPEYLKRVLRVFRWCDSIAAWAGKILVTVPDVPRKVLADRGLLVLQMPHNLSKEQWEIFYGRTLSAYCSTVQHAWYLMEIHEDGFPTNPELWTSEFLRYDYIGAPWHDGVVGSGGMSLMSIRLKLATGLWLPWFNGRSNYDEWVCRTHKEALEKRGITFAPTDLADRYCTESMRNETPSFGFHGRNHAVEKYKAAWEKIEAWEKERKLENITV